MSWIWDKCVNRTVSPAVSGAVVSLMRRGNAGTADDEEAAVPQADADLVVTLRADPAGPALITVSGELDYRAAGAGAVLALAGPRPTPSGCSPSPAWTASSPPTTPSAQP